MSGPAPAASAPRSDSLRRMAGLLRFWTGAPRLGLLLAATALMLFLVVGNPPTAHAAVPEAPTSVTVAQETTVTDANFANITVSWTAPTGMINSYDISVDDGSTWDELTDDGTVASVTLPDVSYGMAPGNTYKVKIRAVNDDGDGAASSAVEVMLISVDMGQNAVKLNWETPSTTGVSQWQYSKDGGVNWTDISGSGASTTSFTDTGLENQSTREYSVRALNSSNTTLITSFILPVVVGKFSYGIDGLTEQYAEFGISTALCSDGRTLFVGAEGEDGRKGAVHIFTRSGPVWSHSDRIADDTHGLSLSALGNFGSALTLSADCNTLAVGASAFNKAIIP